MTDRTPDFYVASFWDGPLSGAKLDLTSYPDKIVVTLDNGQVWRYEHDETQTTESREGGTWGDVCRMVVSRDEESFDEEMIETLKGQES